MRDVRFRRALSLAINRHEINEVVYFGLAKESSNTVLQRARCYRPEFRTAWSQYDVKAANALLDALGLTKRDAKGLRLLPDGRPMEIVVDTSGESTEETDVLELVRDSWRKVGIALFSRPSQREVFRKRVFSGKSMMSVWSGLNNGIPTPDMSPHELAPTAQEQLQWPMWGQYYENNRKGGEAPDMPEAQELVELYDAWRISATDAEREQIWLRMLEIHAQQVYTIGIVARALQPVVVERRAAQRPGRRHLQLGSRARTSACTTPTRSGSSRRGAADAALRRQPHAADDPDDDRDQHHRLHHHPAAAGQLPRKLHRRAAGAGRIGRSAEDRLPAQEYGLDKPLVEQYLRWAWRHAPGRLRLFVRVQPAGDEGGRRPDVPDDHRVGVHDPLHLGRRLPDRDLLGHAPVQLGRLRAVAAGLPRHRDSQLHAGARDAVLRQRLLRNVDRRA